MIRVTTTILGNAYVHSNHIVLCSRRFSVSTPDCCFCLEFAFVAPYMQCVYHFNHEYLCIPLDIFAYTISWNMLDLSFRPKKNMATKALAIRHRKSRTCKR